MSVRSRIKEFEKISQKEAESQEKENLNNRKNETKKRFHLPGKNPDVDGEQGGHNFVLGNKSKGTKDLDADLQQVWSVRRNIHHKGNKSLPHGSGTQPSHHNHHHHHHQGQSNPTGITSNATPSSFKTQNISTPTHYSRHGAIPALPAHPNQVQPLSNKDISRGQRQEEDALQDNQASPWNVKKIAYSYNATNGASMKNVASPPPSDGLYVPSPKRRMNIGGLDVVRPTGEHRPGGFNIGNKGASNEKINYAKRMAQGYLKSVGMGDYTPKTSNYSRMKLPEQSDSTTNPSNKRPSQWEMKDDQDKEFDFDI